MDVSEVEGLIRGSAPGNSECKVGSVKPYIDALTVGSDGCERMEFLGDAVLSVVVTQYLYERFPSSREGFLTKMRAKIVSSRMLSQLAGMLNLKSYVRTTRPHGHSHVALDDVLEAVIAAVCIDAGMEAARHWFINVLEHHVDVSALVSWHDSNKQRLVTLGGPCTFTEMTAKTLGTVSVCVRDSRGAVIATATAGTRREADENAARKALAAHGNRPRDGSAMLPRHALALRASCG